MCLPVCLCICLPTCLSTSVCVSACLSVHLLVCLPVHLSVCVSILASVCLPVSIVALKTSNHKLYDKQQQIDYMTSTDIYQHSLTTHSITITHQPIRLPWSMQVRLHHERKRRVSCVSITSVKIITFHDSSPRSTRGVVTFSEILVLLQ